MAKRRVRRINTVLALKKHMAVWSPEKGEWHCDFCGIGGDTLDLARRLGVRVDDVDGFMGESSSRPPEARK